jgi:hypothetical protein
MSKLFRRWFESMIQPLITERILLFHDALIARGQIKPIPPKSEWATDHCIQLGSSSLNSP